MYIVAIRHNVDVSDEFAQLAKKDEEVARFLKRNGEYRHAIYFFIQAMEKHIRSKIFTLVNPNNEYFRKRNLNHSVEGAVEFLIEIISPDENIRQQVKQLLNKHVLEDINFQLLHNNLRYPFYSDKYNSYSSVDFSYNDCDTIEKKLEGLKRYLQDINRL